MGINFLEQIKEKVDTNFVAILMTFNVYNLFLEKLFCTFDDQIGVSLIYIL